ncbi:hypothetical protein BJV82DRAFT_581354 [Fennellomyces sp. T-0311]|nr:hypothetical protein BJV82DRAFT_581354 [Fennellomyces sp. T-0311]
MEYVNLGPYRFNEAYNTYPIPIPNPKYNYTVTVHCPNGVDCSEGVTIIYANEGAVVRWTLPTTKYEYADVRLSWGNPSMYFASTHWIGDIYMNDQKATYTTNGGFRATDGQDGIPFTNITEAKAPPGRDYYTLVLLSSDPEFPPYKNHNAAYSTQIRVEPSRPRGSNDQTSTASDLAGPRAL